MEERRVLPTTPWISLVLCSRNEQEVISHTITTACHQLETTGFQYEILVVDDSTDATPHIVRGLQTAHPSLQLLHRPEQERNGLGGAILKGLSEACGEYVILMDADGQHPVDILPHLAQLTCCGYDLVIPSRYVSGGSTGGLDGYLRNLYSYLLRLAPRLLFPHRVGKATDPLSGLFMIKARCLDLTRLKPESWKMSLELLLFANWSSYYEIPYHFLPRAAGRSKANYHVGLDYLKHLGHLFARYYRHA